jgi:hypothetical protein
MVACALNYRRSQGNPIHPDAATGVRTCAKVIGASKQSCPMLQKCPKSRILGKFESDRLKLPKTPFFVRVSFQIREHLAITRGLQLDMVF